MYEDEKTDGAPKSEQGEKLQKKEDTDRLVRKAVRGNIDAYGQLIEQNKAYLYRTAFLYCKDEENAMDIVQDAVLSGFRNIGSLKEPDYFRTWLTRILINAAKEHLRKIVPFESLETTEIAAPEKGVPVEEKWDLYEAIDTLPEKMKTVVILKYFNDLKLNEIAEAMQIPEGSVSAYLTRAKMLLQQCLKEGYIYAK